MTFTEAAVEVLRRAGKPLHYKEIAEVAVRENLLSHVGQDPEVTMGQRLAAMAKRDDDRKVLAVAPEGTFALVEWSIPQELVVEPVAPPLHPEEEGATLYRAREREPRPINAQARRRIEALQPGTEEQEEERKRGQRRFPPPAEVVFEWLAQRQSGAPISDLSDALFKKNLLSEALVRDHGSLVQALLEDNRRRTEAGRKPAFIVDGERVTLVEFPAPSALPEEARASHTSLGRPMSAAQLVAEGRRAVVRALRRRVADLETSGFEQLCSQLLEKMGMRDVRVAKRSKEGPLYLARQRRGVSDLRVAVKLTRGSREIGRDDVQELRKDLAHYSAQMGLVLAAGEAGRDARAEASAAGQPPVALYAGDALAEELVSVRVGVSVQVVELADVDEAFFASVAKGGPSTRDRRERPPEERIERGEAAETVSPERPAAEPEPEAAAEAHAPAEPAPPAVSPEVAAPQTEGEDREARRRGRRDERPTRATSAAEQAWGQPIGTPRLLQTAPAVAAEPAPAAGPAEPEAPIPPAGGDETPHE
ncbi:MAG TPA: restriction endonuclease [Myxococcales bacterium]|nr:restriction endonuclease [Myxococcales bacterium]